MLFRSVALRHKWQRMTRELFASNGAAPHDRLRWGLRAWAMPLSVVAHLPKVLFSAKLNGGKERLRAAATLVRLRLLRMVWMLRQAAGLPI